MPCLLVRIHGTDGLGQKPQRVSPPWLRWTSGLLGGESCTRGEVRAEMTLLPWFPKGFPLSPRSWVPLPFAHNWEQGRIGEGSGTGRRKRHTDSDKRGRQTGQRDSPAQEPASSTRACGALMPERQRGECEVGRQERGQRKRVTSGPPKSRNGLGQPDLPIQPSKIRPSILPSSPQPHRRLRWGHPICRGRRRCSLGSFLLRLLLQPRMVCGQGEVPPVTGPVLASRTPILAQPPPTPCLQKKELVLQAG